MSDRSTKRESGFSLLEMMVAMALGTVVLGAAVQIYIQGVSATWKITQRAEMQQDFRAASNLLTKDLSLAGAGLGNGAAIALPSTATPVYGCDQTPMCYINNASSAAYPAGSVTYPTQSGTPYLYGLLPGLNKGPTLSTLQTDTVTVVYADTSFYLNCYTAKVSAKGVVTFAPPASPTPWPTPGCLPNGVSTAQAVNDSAVGLTAGDLVLMTLNGTQVVAEVYGAVTNTGTNTYTVAFANNDPLKMNQTPSAGTGLNSVALNAAGSAGTYGSCPCRILVITYYIDNTVSPARLMRQISGHTPMPVAENIVYLKFSYDLYNEATQTPAINQTDGGVSLSLLPNQITKINILHMAIDSSLKGAQGGYQGMDLETSVSARNLTYTNDYPN
jgi:prepilin-type N-terminal cleavage/methylation domain-containing protein